jgi:uncharacterized membrane protein
MVAEPLPVVIMQANRRHILFLVSILLKGVFALGEFAAGFLIYVTPPDSLAQFVHFMFHNRLVADPFDPLAQFMLREMHDLSVNRHTFISLYLMLHGLVKIGIVAGLLSRKLWAFPVGMVALALFIIYQLHRFAYTHAPLLVLISIFDAFIIWLTWREYQALKRHEI